MPWLTVAENVAFQAKSPRNERATVSALLEEVGLFGTEELLPKQLSGGMAQRVSIARGMFSKPDLLLLDEPFSAVDAFTRMKLQDLLLNMLRLHRNTVLMVTHDIDEAIYLSDRIVVIGGQPGIIREIIEVDFPRPRDRRDATLTGLRAKVLDALHGINVI
jgi:sulfonate transport system ATP-binding protein